MDIGKYIRDLRRAENDPESYWPINAADSLAASFSPLDLFAAGERGAWYDPSDLSTVFQERTGASATTSAGVGDPVGTILDKSGNANHVTAPSDTARPIRRQSGALYYLEFDGSNDILVATNAWMTGASTHAHITVGVSASTAANTYLIGEGRSISTTQIYTPLRAHPSGATNVHGFNRDDTSSAILNPATPTTNTWLDGTVRVLSFLDERNVQAIVRADGVNGDTEAYGSAGTTTCDRFAIGGLQRTTPGQFATMNCYGVVSLDRALTTEELDNLEAYMATKSGVSL